LSRENRQFYYTYVLIFKDKYAF